MRSQSRRWAVFLLGALFILAGAYWVARGLRPIVSLQYLVDLARDLRAVGPIGWISGGAALVLVAYLALFSQAARRGRLGVLLLGILVGSLGVLGVIGLSGGKALLETTHRLLASLGYKALEVQGLVQQSDWLSQLFEVTGFSESDLLAKVRESGLTKIARDLVDTVRRVVAFTLVAGPGLIAWWALIWGSVGDWIFGPESEPSKAPRSGE